MFYTLEQVASKLQVEVRDVQRIIKAGQLEVIELPGNVKRVSEAALNGIRPTQNTQPANGVKAPAKKPATQAQLDARARFGDMARKRAEEKRQEAIQPPPEAAAEKVAAKTPTAPAKESAPSREKVAK
jgi:hypothetical protein